LEKATSGTVSALAHRTPAMLAAPPAAAGRLYLANARLFDGTGAAVREPAGVLVEDGRIARIDDSAAAPAGARTIDLAGRTLMPGLTDSHLHVSGRKPEPADGAEEILDGTPHHFLQASLRDFLRFGVTTLRDMGSQGRQPQEARQAMRYGAFRGPRLLTCAKIISATAPGGRFYGDMYREADGPDDVRKAVREQIRNGADLVKVMTTGARSNELEDPGPTQFTAEEFAAAVDEAHRLGFKIAAHAEGLAGVGAAVDHGMDTIEHGMYLNQQPALLERMAQNGQFLVPTLTGYYWMAGLGDAVEPEGAERNATLVPMLVELADHNLAEGARSMVGAKRAGVRIALGSDGPLRAENVSLELLRMIHHGLTAAEALVAATRTGAEALGIDEHVGTVEPGKLADLLIVDGDPLSEPQLLRDRGSIWLVIQSGEPVAGAALEHDVADIYADRST
jgi:imidazolonepropionase-like amidohydrolase